MKTKETNAAKSLSKPEIFWIVFESLFGVAGIILIILGFIADYLKVAYSDNYLLQAQQKILQGSNGLLTFRWIGFILVLAGALIAVASLTIFAKKRDVNNEREARRQERLKIISESVVETPVVDAPSAPVESTISESKTETETTSEQKKEKLAE